MSAATITPTESTELTFELITAMIERQETPSKRALRYQLMTILPENDCPVSKVVYDFDLHRTYGSTTYSEWIELSDTSPSHVVGHFRESFDKHSQLLRNYHLAEKRGLPEGTLRALKQELDENPYVTSTELLRYLTHRLHERTQIDGMFVPYYKQWLSEIDK